MESKSPRRSGHNCGHWSSQNTGDGGFGYVRSGSKADATEPPKADATERLSAAKGGPRLTT